jgi:hypothetical protein
MSNMGVPPWLLFKGESGLFIIQQDTAENLGKFITEMVGCARNSRSK